MLELALVANLRGLVVLTDASGETRRFDGWPSLSRLAKATDASSGPWLSLRGLRNKFLPLGKLTRGPREVCNCADCGPSLEAFERQSAWAGGAERVRWPTGSAPTSACA